MIDRAHLSRVSSRYLSYALPDALLILFSLSLSLLLRVGWTEFSNHFSVLLKLSPVFLLVRLFTFRYFKVYSIIWRHVSFQDLFLLVKAVTLSSVFTVASTYFLSIERIPRATFFIDTVVVTLLLVAIRFGRRFSYEHRNKKRTQDPVGRRTLIYGASANGRLLAERLKANVGEQLSLMGFIDDDVYKVGCLFMGAKVLGGKDQLAHYLETLEIQELFIAIDSPPRDFLNKVMEICRPFNIRPRLIENLSKGNAKKLEICRPINFNDLLKRSERKIDLSSVRAEIKGSVVLVTGAGGSIGSELARQILQFNPSRLLLLDHSELNLYEIDKELRTSPNEMSRVIPLLVDIKDRDNLERVFKNFSPDFVFHAAAYKHVHLVEANPLSSILNNVLGTRNCIEFSKKYQVENFIMISSDKAVNPVGVMGSTKRLCELMVTHAGLETGRRFASVRFGNVLGSSGSLIPLLQKQILEEEMVTITDKEMVRYFMLIPEAVSLVLKASSMAEPGDVMVLKMGEPIKIVDIARTLITLMGKSPEEISIVYTGMRPGEKLFEELYINGNEIITEDPDILVIPRGDKTLRGRETARLADEINQLILDSQIGAYAAISRMQDLVQSEYQAKEDFPLFTFSSETSEVFRSSRVN